MGLLSGILRRRGRSASHETGLVSLPPKRFTPTSPWGESAPGWMSSETPVALIEGYEDLEVVGESHYQDHLWRIVGGRSPERVRQPCAAILVAENDNRYDPNAISVWIEQGRVGYLSRNDATALRPGLLAAQEKHGQPIALAGVICGGGIDRPDGPHGMGFLGVFLSYDPPQFGIRSLAPAPLRTGRLRTGLSEALATDEADDTYDLSWTARLSDNPARRATQLRALLDEERDPISRHFVFTDLEELLYSLRDVTHAALDEYDGVCTNHDREMDVIRPALYDKFKTVPLLSTYRQQAIRCQKARDLPRAIWWAERGLELYGRQAAQESWTLDLQKRLANYRSKLSPPTRHSTPDAIDRGHLMETLTCRSCGTSYERLRTRGRKPHRCPACRS